MKAKDFIDKYGVSITFTPIPADDDMYTVSVQPLGRLSYRLAGNKDVLTPDAVVLNLAEKYRFAYSSQMIGNGEAIYNNRLQARQMENAWWQGDPQLFRDLMALEA